MKFVSNHRSTLIFINVLQHSILIIFFITNLNYFAKFVIIRKGNQLVILQILYIKKNRLQMINVNFSFFEIRFIKIPFIILLFLISSCKKHKNEDTVTPTSNTPVTYKGTPYNLQAPYYFGSQVAAPGNPLTVEGVYLGRMLFYEKKLSGNNTMSCGSCHKQKFAFADSSAFSTGIDGLQGTRNAMALSNLAWQKKFFWDGRANSIEEQALGPIQNPVEMHQTLTSAIQKLQNTPTYPPLFKAAFGTEVIDATLISMAIAQFERTLISSRSRYDQFRSGDQSALTAQEQNGYLLFTTHPVPSSNIYGANCSDCHSEDLQTNNTFQNNGIDSVFTDLGLEAITKKSSDSAKFKVPSLRNIALTPPYMHDGRFNNLQQVLQQYNAHVSTKAPLFSPIMGASNTQGGFQLDLTQQQIDDVIAFLNTLTDTQFITDTTFSDPNKH
jgi:cytochrome c peroxidase